MGPPPSRESCCGRRTVRTKRQATHHVILADNQEKWAGPQVGRQVRTDIMHETFGLRRESLLRATTADIAAGRLVEADESEVMKAVANYWCASSRKWHVRPGIAIE